MKTKVIFIKVLIHCLVSAFVVIILNYAYFNEKDEFNKMMIMKISQCQKKLMVPK